MSIEPGKLEEIIAATTKQYKTAFHKGSEHPPVTRIPFDSLELNMATGGGMPMGRMGRIWGHESSGKSLNTLLLAKQAQNIHIYAEQLLDSEFDEVKEMGQDILNQFPDGMIVCLYDAEGSFDPKFAKDLGVDIDKLNVFPDQRIEVIGETLEAALGAAHLHIVDSTAGAVSLDELKAKIAEWQRGLKARVWNKVLDRFKAGIGPENSIVFVDQVRVDQKTGALMAPGGKKMAHESSLTVQLKGKELYRKGDELVTEMPQKDAGALNKDKVESVGLEIQAVCKKNRVGQQGRRAFLHYKKDDRDFDRLYELSKAAKWLGVADEYATGRFELPSGEKIHGAGNLRVSIAEDIELKKKVVDAVQLYIARNP